MFAIVCILLKALMVAGHYLGFLIVYVSSKFVYVVEFLARLAFSSKKQAAPDAHASGAAPISAIYFLAPNTRVHAQRVSTAVPTATAIGSHALAP